MKLDWERVRLLIWLRKCQVRHAHARHGRGWWTDLQSVFFFAGAALALVAGLALGYFVLGSSETATLLAWDGWAALVCYLWMAGLAAEAQRADPIDVGRLLHLPVSLREAFVINFTASLYNLPNVLGLAGALGLVGGQALHRPAAFVILPVAVLFLFTVSAWAQVLRSWFLKVFRNPRRRRWLSIGAGLILMLAGQLPNLVNLLNIHYSGNYAEEARAEMEKVSVPDPGEAEAYDPSWASLPPGTVLDSDNAIYASDSPHPRIYRMPDKQTVFRVTYTRSVARTTDGRNEVRWRTNYWQVRDGVWRRAPIPPLGQSAILEDTEANHDPRYDYHQRATENLDGVPADLRELWPLEKRYPTHAPATYHGPGLFGGLEKLGQSGLHWHIAIPAGWPAWIAASSVRGDITIPLLAGLSGFLLLTALGMRRAWSIQRDAILMTEKAPRSGKFPAATPPAARWSPATDKSASLTKPLALFPPAVACLTRTFLRSWARSVEIRFQIIVACGLAAGAVGVGFFVWWTERGAAGAFQVVSSIMGLTGLAFAGLFINFFGYDRSACRAMILAPVSAREVLLAKNAAIAQLVIFTSLPFVAAAALISGEWLMSALAWVLLAPAALLLCLALGNSSSVATPWPIRAGQRHQGRPDAATMGHGCLHLLIYLGIAFVLQVPQLLVAWSGEPWAGVLAAALVQGSAWAVWHRHFPHQARKLHWHFSDVADAVGKSTDM